MQVWILIADIDYEGTNHPVAAVFDHEPTKHECETAKADYLQEHYADDFRVEPFHIQTGCSATLIER